MKISMKQATAAITAEKMGLQSPAPILQTCTRKAGTDPLPSINSKSNPNPSH